MPSPPRDPNKIPDMSLDDHAIVPAPPVPAPLPPVRDPSTAYQPSPSNETASSAPLSSGTDSPPDWQVGDRVLAPWEPMFLYAGTIHQLVRDDARGDQALIDFDDGDSGWVYLYSLVPLRIQPGQKVFARRHGARLYDPAEVVEVDREEICLSFDRNASEWSTVAALRIPCIENGPGAMSTSFGYPVASQPLAVPASTGIPGWVIWIGVMILIAIVRIMSRSAW